MDIFNIQFIDFFKDVNFILIIIEIIFASLLSLIAVFSFSQKKTAGMFFIVIGALSLFIRMTSHILSELHIIHLNEILYKGTQLYSTIIEIVPYILLSIGIILISKEK